jgi:pteridine reductase
VNGKTVLVTGAAKRVGCAIAREMHAAGANVMLHYRTATADAESLVSEFNTLRPASAACLQADLLDITQLPLLVAATIARFGRLDALVNNASSFFATPLGEIDLAVWNDLIGTNLKAPLFLTQAAAPYLRATRGAVVNITDIHAERPLAAYPLYCAAKAGLLGLTRALAIELAPEVRVNAVAPGPMMRLLTAPRAMPLLRTPCCSVKAARRKSHARCVSCWTTQPMSPARSSTSMVVVPRIFDFFF